MLKTRMRDWLLDHPHVLTFAFVAFLKWGEYVPDDITVQGGSSAYKGP